MKIITDVCYSQEHQQFLDIYLPECDSFPVFVYFHGGGLEAGDKANGYALFFEYLTTHGIAVVSANYRMYPDAKYPDFLVDGAKTIKWVFDNIKIYGNATDIYVGGSSAGGYMSQMLCFDKQWLAAQDLCPMDIKGFIHDAGQPTCHFNVLRERGLDTRRVIIDETAPIYHVGVDAQYPPMLIVVSDNDMPNRLEQTQLLVSTLREFEHTENVQLQMMHSSHCAYVRKGDENGVSVFGPIVEQFILSH